MNPLLTVRNLEVSYGAIDAIRGINITVGQGTIVAVLGANGGGKTTLLKTISGLVKPKAGTIDFDGSDLLRLSPEKIAAAGVVQSPEGRQIFGELTVGENLDIGAFTVRDKGERKRNRQRVMGYFPVLGERETQVAQTLSGGEQQMLAIGRALMASPKLLILDEPSLGLAPKIVQTIFTIIKELNSEGTTVLLVEQNALQTLKIADYGYVLQVGSVVREGPAAQLKADPSLVEAYLGKER